MSEDEEDEEEREEKEEENPPGNRAFEGKGDKAEEDNEANEDDVASPHDLERWYCLAKSTDSS